MKTKTQVRIGLITAVVCIAHLIIITLYDLRDLGVEDFGGLDLLFSCLFIPLPFLFVPISYIFTLINKKLIAVWIIFLLWCATLIISFVLPDFSKFDPYDDYINLTMMRYTHTLRGQVAAALNGQPNFQKDKLTGTE